MITRSFKQTDIKESWILVDAEDKTLGRLASSLASRLRGKHRPEFTPNADLGDYIVVVNASKIWPKYCLYLTYIVEIII